MYSQEVFKTWTLILQLGLSILVPIFLLVGIAIFINDRFSIDVILIMTILGVIVGIRNGYVLVRGYLKSDTKKKESELMEKHKKSIKK